ncbi:hypothetical protein Tco_0313028 [Tanacetum coccineum]
MAEFIRQVQCKDILNLMKLQILGREFELRAQEKGVFIEKLKGNLDVWPNLAIPGDIDAVVGMTISLTKELFTPFKDPEREFRSSRKHFKTLSLEESRSPDFDLFSDKEEYSEEEVAETMAETMEQYMSKTRADYESGVMMTSNNVYFIASFILCLRKKYRLNLKNDMPPQKKKYPLRKEVLMQMLKLKLESEEDSTIALELIRHKNWLVHKQTACGKDFSNPFMVDNLPKIVRFLTHLASVVKSWLVHDQTVHALASPNANELTIPEQTATGKGTSNPLMAGSLPKTTKPT